MSALHDRPRLARRRRFSWVKGHWGFSENSVGIRAVAAQWRSGACCGGKLCVAKPSAVSFAPAKDRGLGSLCCGSIVPSSLLAVIYALRTLYVVKLFRRLESGVNRR